MEIIIIGKRGDKRIIRWSRVVGLALALTLFIGCGMATVYRALSGSWELQPALLGILFGVAVVGVGMFKGLNTPLDKLRTVG